MTGPGPRLIVALVLGALGGAARAQESRGDLTRATVSVGANVVTRSETYGNPSDQSNASGLAAGGSVDATWYFRGALVDDDAPLSLQQFLQRKTLLAAHGSGQYLDFDYSPQANGGTYRQGYTGDSITTRYFVHHNLALVASLELDYLTDRRAPSAGATTRREIRAPQGSLGVDLRLADASLFFDWHLLGTYQASGPGPGTWRDIFWPRFSFGGRLVVHRRVDLTASVTLIPDGAEGRAGVGVYPTRKLGLTLFVQADHGAIYADSATDYDRLLATAGISWWLNHRVNGTLYYNPSWTSGPRSVEWAHQLAVSLTARIP